MSEFYDALRSATFAGFLLLEWTEQDGPTLADNARSLLDGQATAARLWAETEPMWPKSAAITTGWIVGRSAAITSLEFCQELCLVVRSLEDEQRVGKLESFKESHDAIVEAVREWYGFDPTRHELIALRRQAMSQIDHEWESYLDSEAEAFEGKPRESTNTPTAGEDELVISDVSYRTARWKGQIFKFTLKQAMVVKRLAEARTALPNRELLASAESEGKDLRDIFKGKAGMHPAWGSLIVPDESKGWRKLSTQKIRLPEKNPA